MRKVTDVVGRSILLLSAIVSSNRRFSVKDCMDATGLGKRAAQRYMAELEELEFIQGDECSPRGYKATEKSKQLFKVAA